MTSEASDPRQALERERDRLDALLERTVAWRALRQLDQRGSAARPAPAADTNRLRSRIEAALAGNRIYQARCKLTEAIALLGAAPDTPAAESGPATVAAETVTPPADDLTRIRGIDAALASRLAAAGVQGFADIAGWTAADVRRISEALALDRRIQRQNWIEQAALIVSRERPQVPPPPAEIERAASRPAPPPLPVPVPVPGRVAVAALAADAVRRIVAGVKPPSPAAVAAPPPAIAAAETPPPAAADDLTAIAGIDHRIAELLRGAGFATHAAIARWSAGDVARMRAALGPGAPVVRAQWIEQAAMLAAGRPTRHARVRASNALVPVAPRPPSTAVARDEGFACEIRAMRPDPASATGPAPPSGDWADEVAVTDLVDLDPPAAEARAADVPASGPIEVTVSPPQPVDAARPSGAALELPPLGLSAPSGPSGSHGIEAAAIDYESDTLLDIAAAGFAEADVRIVAASSAALGEDVSAADQPEDDPRPLVYGGGAGSLQSRLRKAGDHGDEFDSRGYAAYRSAIEEASVEIVHRGAPPREPPAAGGSASSGREESGPKTVRRFLKALTGQER